MTMAHSWTQINLDSLAWNHRLITSRISPKAQLLAVVKANAYGHGMIPVARHLFELGVRWFGVANVQEGRHLREVLPQASILVLGCILTDDVPVLFEHDLVPTVSSLDFAAELNARAERRNMRKAVHLKVDTGMGRLGISTGSLEEFLSQISFFDHIRVEGLMSHFSSSAEDDLAISPAPSRLYENTVRRAEAAGLPLQWVHLANSSGIFRLPQSHYNLVRCGLFLYGLYPEAGYRFNFGLKPVLEWKAKVGHVKEFQAGQTISYGRTHAVTRATRIAVIPVGYADGYNRRLSNRGRVLIRGEFAPVVGRVTMDHIMVDVGHIAGVCGGDEAVLIGRQGQPVIRAEDMAQWLETISYEVVCAIGPRVERRVVPIGVARLDRE